MLKESKDDNKYLISKIDVLQAELKSKNDQFEDFMASNQEKYWKDAT